MSISSYKRLTILLSVACAALLLVSGWLFWRYGWLYIQVAMASEQTKIFEQMRERALESNSEGAAGCLQYVVNYYPSGSKQDTGSRLDRIVEQQRAHAVRDIVAFLRTNTTEDLGDDAKLWIQKYAEESGRVSEQ